MTLEDLLCVITQEDGRRIEKECFAGGIELAPEENGAGIPSLRATPGCGLQSHFHCSWSCFTVSCLDQCHRLLLVP